MPVPIRNSVSHDSDDELDSTQTRYEKSSEELSCETSSDGVMSIEELLLLVQIFGPPSLQKKLRKLLKKYKDIFSTSVSPQPAKVDTPMEIKVNSSQWFSKHNRLRSAKTTIAKETTRTTQVYSDLITL